MYNVWKYALFSAIFEKKSFFNEDLPLKITSQVKSDDNFFYDVVSRLRMSDCFFEIIFVT